jgi:RsiW-degrading membrane proteinase PrsW (M82 family)
MSRSNALLHNWGTVCWHGHHFSIRQLVAWAGVAVWLLVMIVSYGTGGIVALWTALVFMVVLIVLTSATRTVSIRQVTSLFLLGGFTMGLAYVVAQFIPHSALRDFVVPPMEELFKIAPVLFVLWRWRRSTTWTLGVTDVMLLAAASGVGFGMVEDAFIRHNRGWPAHIDWLPLTEITGGRLIVGHGIWTALAGITLGLALLLRSRRELAIGLGASGFLWSTLDHIANNFGVNQGEAFGNFLNGITGQGWVTFYLFVVGVAIAIGFDLYIIHVQLPKFPECKLPRFQNGVSGLKTMWAFLVDRRALAYVLFRYRRAPGIVRAELACFGAILDQALLNRHAGQDPSFTEPALILPVRDYFWSV